MNKYHNQSKGKQVFAAQQMLNASHPGPVVAPLLTHEDIATHAYEIYIEKGRPQGQSEQNWRQAGREVKHQDQAGQVVGDRSDADGACDRFHRRWRAAISRGDVHPAALDRGSQSGSQYVLGFGLRGHRLSCAPGGPE